MATKKTIKVNNEKNTQNEKDNNKTFAILIHLSGIVFGFLGPLIIFLVSKDAEIKDHAKRALNWQLTYFAVYLILFGILFVGAIGSMFLTLFVNPIFFIIYFLFFALMIPIMILGLANLVFCIIAALKANEGIAWEYPFSLKILK
jgi:uncharacterized Tic20 family protein